MQDICIIIQGPSDYVQDIKSCLKSYHNILFSTWKGEENKYLSTDTVIFNDKPNLAGTGNLAYQQISTMNGLIKAKAMGFSQAIKIRSDMLIYNTEHFLSLFNKELNFFFWYEHMYGYIVDYIMGGSIDKMIDLWDIDITRNYEYAEQALTNSFLDKQLYKFDHYFFGNLITSQTDIFWIKKNIFLSEFSSYKSFITKTHYEL